MNKQRRKEIIKRIFAIICAAALMLAFLSSVVMPAMAVTQQQLDAAKKKTEQAKKDKQKADAELKKAKEEFQAIDKQISDTETEIGQLESEIEKTEEDIAKKQEELVLAEAEYERYKNLFFTRARIMYENSDVKYLEILFGAKSFSDFLSKIEMITQLMEYDRDILKKLDETKKSIMETKKALEDSLVTLEENKKIMDTKMDSLQVVLKQKEELLKKAESNKELHDMLYESAEASEKAMIEANKNAFSYGSNPVKFGGTLAWPVPGSHRITSEYGYRIHPVYKTKKFHTGIDIGAGYGLDIIAAGSGVVTLATTNGGYGKCVVINHGSGISTLYGHCSTLLVSNGQSVEKGQRIAKVGSTGVSTGPHLHFEVRINGATTDPMTYVTSK